MTDTTTSKKTNTTNTELLTVETPIGTITVQKASDPLYPGVWITLRRPDSDYEMSVALVEHDEKEGLVTRVWGNAMEEDYTQRIFHQSIDKFFADDSSAE